MEHYTMKLSPQQINDLLKSYAKIDQINPQCENVEKFLFKLYENGQVYQALCIGHKFKRKHNLLCVNFFQKVKDDLMLNLQNEVEFVDECFYQALNGQAFFALKLYLILKISHLEIALFFLKLSADASYAPAAILFGMQYYNGNTFTKNYTKAFDYMFVAALQDEEIGLNNCGDFYLNGIGTKINYSYAYYFLKRAYDMGNMTSVSDIAYLLYNGLGVDQDQDEAIRLWHQHAKLGDKFCIQYLNQYSLTNNLS